MRRLNKKAQEEGLELILIPVILLILLIFIIIFETGGFFEKDRKITIENIKISEDRLFLMNFLRSSIIYKETDIKMFQLIAAMDEAEIEKNTKEILDKYCQKPQNALKDFKDNKCFWEFFIRYKDKALYYSGGSYPGALDISTSFFSKIKFNDMNNEEIIIELRRYPLENE